MNAVDLGKITVRQEKIAWLELKTYLHLITKKQHEKRTTYRNEARYNRKK